MKQIWATIFGLLCITAVALADGGDIAARLNAPQDRVRFDQAALSDALAITGETVHLNVIADWATLLNAGIKQTTQVSMEFDNVSAATTFDVICRLIGGDTTWVVQDGVIHVTTEEALDKNGELKPYWPNGIGGMLDERAAKATKLLRDYIPELEDNSIRLSNGRLLVRGSAQTQEKVAHVLQLCDRAMTPREWRDLLGVEADLDNSRQRLSVSWESFPVGRCLSDFSTRINTPIVLDMSVNPQQPITVDLKNVTPRQVLEGILAAGGGADPSFKGTGWTCEPIAHGRILWIGPSSNASDWCATYMLGPPAMRELHINSPEEAPSAICSAVGGCDSGHVRWVGGDRILCRQKMDQILAIGKLLADPSFMSAMRPGVTVGRH